MMNINVRSVLCIPVFPGNVCYFLGGMWTQTFFSLISADVGELLMYIMYYTDVCTFIYF